LSPLTLGSRFALTHSLTSFRVNTPVPSSSDRKAGPADLIAPMATTISVACSTDVGALLALALLAALSGCGPAPSDQAPSLESRASVARPSELPPVLPHTSSIHQAPTPPSPYPAPLASNHKPTPEVKDEPAPLPEQLVLPQWIAQALEAPDVRVRLRALDRWAQQGPEASLDPLVVALDDQDEDVRTKAMALIERQWAVAQEAEPKATP